MQNIQTYLWHIVIFTGRNTVSIKIKCVYMQEIGYFKLPLGKKMLAGIKSDKVSSYLFTQLLSLTKQNILKRS